MFFCMTNFVIGLQIQSGKLYFYLVKIEEQAMRWQFFSMAFNIFWILIDKLGSKGLTFASVMSCMWLIAILKSGYSLTFIVLCYIICVCCLYAYIMKNIFDKKIDTYGSARDKDGKYLNFRYDYSLIFGLCSPIIWILLS